MTVCPKCGFDLVGSESECPSCGVIIAKVQAARPRPTATTEELTSTTRAVVMTDLRGNATKRRLFAAMIDNTIAMLVCLLSVAMYTSYRPDRSDEGINKGVIAMLVYLSYYFVQEGIWGTTLGKRAFGLQVVRVDGGRVGWWEAWLRTLLRILEVNPLLLGAIPGGLAIAWSRRKQRLGDMMAGTVVVNRDALASAQAQIKAIRGA